MDCILWIIFVDRVTKVSLSFLKRKSGIKDASFILPGHGGLLDRADSILPVFILIPILVIIFDLIENPSLIVLGW